LEDHPAIGSRTGMKKKKRATFKRQPGKWRGAFTMFTGEEQRREKDEPESARLRSTI